MARRRKIVRFDDDCPCRRTENSRLGYLQWHEDAAERRKRGEKQKRCPVGCMRWLWESEHAEALRIAAREGVVC